MAKNAIYFHLEIVSFLKGLNAMNDYAFRS